MHVPLDEFVSILDDLEAAFEVIPLWEIAQRVQANRSTAGLVALTFDDAYEALAGLAQPAMRQRQLPFTVFVVSAAARSGAAFWWDRVDALNARLSGARWQSFMIACGLPHRPAQSTDDRAASLEALRDFILAIHRGLWPSELEPVLAAFESEAGVELGQRSMTFDELRRLASQPNVSLGVHTTRHPVLPLLSDAQIHDEIAGSHRELQDEFANVLPVLAVPFGLFDERTISIARQAGMTTSVTLTGTTLAYASASQLPRICVMRGEAGWRLSLRVAGVPERIRDPLRRRGTEYPVLPTFGPNGVAVD